MLYFSGTNREFKGLIGVITFLLDSVLCWQPPPVSEHEVQPTVSQQRVWRPSQFWPFFPALRLFVCPAAWF